VEKIGGWEGYNHSPLVYVVDNLVVLLSPDQHTLYVRTAEAKWKFFSMQFPDERSSLPMIYYTALTTLTEEELSSIRKDIDSEEKEWSPSIWLKAFDPVTREVHVLYRTTPSKVRHILLKLSPDGTDLTSVSIKKEKQRY
jgi:hypothetical protein